ncbi:hypothetical protein [Cochlodiniinecator piscidefendens]|uniref:hypothetical protein n=1 Tax=Cochlodiniinecator piscidefendens TaxID=2715756 RepID=UPI00197B5E59|nr:hypothetical protein [Cochlodiniinecator piscidefendens]
MSDARILRKFSVVCSDLVWATAIAIASIITRYAYRDAVGLWTSGSSGKSKATAQRAISASRLLLFVIAIVVAPYGLFQTMRALLPICLITSNWFELTLRLA